MKKTFNLLINSIFVLLLSSPKLTAGQCGFLKVWLFNSTKNTCYLLFAQVENGILLNEPPEMLVPGQPKLFYLAQKDTYGPKLTVQYHCAEDIITITSKQNFCLFEGADIKGIVRDPIPKNIFVSYIIETGSFSEDRPGLIRWLFSDK